MPALPTPGGSDVWGANLNAAIESLHIGPDTHANRPTTSLVTGALYSCTDHNLIYRWSGSAWVTFATLGGGSSGGTNPDDPATWGSDLGFDYEFTATATTPPTGWAWVNQGAATYAEKRGGAVLRHPGQASGDSVRAVTRSLSGAPATWELVAKVVNSWQDDAEYGSAGLVLRDSTSGKMVTFGRTRNSSVTVALTQWSSPSAVASNVTLSTTIPATDIPAYHYWRIVKSSATSWAFETSRDGLSWRPINTYDVSAFMTPNEVGFYAHRGGNGNWLDASCHWLRLR